MSKLTADTITAAQIRELRENGLDEHESDTGDYANLDELARCAIAGDSTAKRRCAEILNARNGAKP